MKTPSAAILGTMVVAGLSTLGCGAKTIAAGTDEGDDRSEIHRVVAICAPTSMKAGQLDTTFGGAGTGIARSSFGADDDGAFFSLDVVGERIIAGGWGMGGLGGIKFRVARLGMAGERDASFGNNGMVTTHWAASTGDNDYAVSVGHQRDGGVIAMGYRDPFHMESANIALARYGADGALDPQFGDAGKALIDLGGAEEVTKGLVLPDDTILVVGRRDDALLVARATKGGALDTTFASPAGYFTLKVGSSSVARSVAVDEVGRILVAGAANMGTQTDVLLLRLTPDGALDTSFGAGGEVLAGRPAFSERAVAVAPAADGRIVVAGDAGPQGARDFQVRRFLSDGSPDMDFGEKGVATGATTPGDDAAEDMVVLPGGGILVAGNTVGQGGAYQPILGRYTCRGGLDEAFGNGGVLPVNLGEYGVLHAVRMYAPDQVLLGGGDVGETPGPGTYGEVARMWM